MSADYSTLSNFLKVTKIPSVQENFGFLELIKKQTHENINSQIYAHFLSSDISEIRDAFLNAITDLIAEKSDLKLDLTNSIVNTEVITQSDKRIDIVIEDFTSQSAIIIENKIYHILNNELTEYWDHYNKYSFNNRKGVLLTLHDHEIPEDVKSKFINITHIEWIKKVKKKLKESNLPNNYQVYLTDFYNTIENLTKSYSMNESAKFYFKHAVKVQQISETKDEAYNFLNQQLNLACSTLGLDMHGDSSMEWKNFWDSNNNIKTYLTILTGELIKGNPKFTIVLELYMEDTEKAGELDILLKGEPQYEDVDKKKGEIGANHFHYLTQEYKIKPEEFENLGKTIVKKVRNDFAKITLMAIKHNYPHIDISKWEKQFLGDSVA